MAEINISRIVRLEVENVKRINAIDITPNGNAVVIGGRNGQGKSSILDAIMMALGGKDTHCQKPVKAGAESGRVTVDLGDMIAERVFYPDGRSVVKLKNADGATYSSPQSILDKMTGNLTFDPLAFMRMNPKDHLQTLRDLAGLDFTALDTRRAELFAERTAVNREEKDLFGHASSMPKHPDVSGMQEVQITDLTAQLRAAGEANAKVQGLQSQLQHFTTQIGRSTELIADLEDRLVRAKAEHAEFVAKKDGIEQELAFSETVDTVDLERQIAAAEATNRKIRENAAYNQVVDRQEATKARAQGLTADIQAVDAQKQEMLAAAKFPVPGLSFDENGVLFNKLPLDQASGAEKLRVSVAMAIATNPRLKIMLIRDGSLLDDDSLKIIFEMARESNAQAWIERVGEGEEVSVVIEDGYVKGAPKKQLTIEDASDNVFAAGKAA